LLVQRSIFGKWIAKSRFSSLGNAIPCKKGEEIERQFFKLSTARSAWTIDILEEKDAVRFLGY
jgi:hypothetical protein